MPDSDLVTHTLDVPGARLYYERRGSGPLEQFGRLLHQVLSQPA